VWPAGVEEVEYRDDWALIELQDGLVGKNGTWWEEYILEMLRIQLGLRPGTKFTGKVVGVEDSELGNSDVWFKDGATTGWTVGALISTDVHLYLPRTSFGIANSEGVHPAGVGRGKVHMMGGTQGGAFAAIGDSGSGVFKVTPDGRDFVFGAMVLSEFTPIMGRTLIMVAPVTRVLDQVAKATGVGWEVAQ